MGIYTNFITDQGVEQLTKYKYQSGAYTPLELALNHFWLWLVELMPRNLAPNMITIMGASSLSVSGFVLILIDPTLGNKYPAWVYLLGVLGVFMHQTLDAIDGKQARRIKASSPLGQLLDHGLDAYISTFMSLIASISLAYPKDSIVFWILLIVGAAGMYLANACEYFTGVLETNQGYFGVTEMQVTAMLSFSILGLFPNFTFRIELFAGITLSDVAVAFICLQFFNAIWMVMDKMFKSDRSSSNIFKVLGALFLALIPSVLFALDRHLFCNSNGYVLMTIGTLFALLICKVIISTVSKQAFPWKLYETLIPVLGYVAVKQFGDSDQNSQKNKAIIMLMFFAMQLTFFTFAVTVTIKIATVLDIPILTVRQQKGYAEVQNSDSTIKADDEEIIPVDVV